MVSSAMTSIIKIFFVAMTITTTTVIVTEAVYTSCKSVETYNVGLTSSVGDLETRKPKIIQALASSTADYICLQEIWQEQDMEEFIEELSSVFPHHYSAIHKSKDVLRKPYKPGYFPLKDRDCGPVETSYLSGAVGFCAWWNDCTDKSGYELGECIATECDYLLKSSFVSPSCVSCIFMNAFHSLTEAVKLCSLPSTHHNRMNGPGLLVMSKEDLGDVEYKTFYPGKRMNLQRGYIRSDIGDGTNAVCTHLSSNVAGYIEYDVDFGNYKAQQTHEIKQLNRTFSGMDTVLLGDLNTGPRVTSAADPQQVLEGEFTDNYDLLVDHGFVSPYVTDEGFCTYCTDNDLVGDYPNQILDHVMVRPAASFTTASDERLYDSESPSISDHYGVRLQVCPV